MSTEFSILMIGAASIGFFHTLLGPDHYLPFIVMGKARRWSLWKTGWITVACGMGHIGGSVLLGMVGIALGIAVKKLEWIESVRGDIAAWALIAFGLIYFVWGMNRAWQARSHEHGHAHADGVTHVHEHNHMHEHLHVHDTEEGTSVAPWVIFTIFVLGPCEPLIPLLMYPAARESVPCLIGVTAAFGIVTIATMLAIVLASARGFQFLSIRKMEKYSHALAGGTICLCGLAIQFLGL
jgi:ABC-type nickel/cobalt efflux system permease component RcnA